MWDLSDCFEVDEQLVRLRLEMLKAELAVPHSNGKCDRAEFEEVPNFVSGTDFLARHGIAQLGETGGSRDKAGAGGTGCGIAVGYCELQGYLGPHNLPWRVA